MAAGAERTQLVAFVLLVLLAVALGGLIDALRSAPPAGGQGGGAAPPPPRAPAPGPPSPLAQEALLVLAALGAALVVALLVSEARGRRRTRWLPAAFNHHAFVLALLGLALALLLLASLQVRRDAVPLLPGEQEPPAALPPASNTPVPPGVPAALPVGLLLLVAAVGIVLAVGLARASIGRPRPPAATPRASVAQELGRAVEALEGGGDYREVVLRCYANCCRLLAARGAPEDEALTAREFEGRARALLGLPEAALARLTALFEEARYSPHPVGPTERDSALACLRRVREELGG